MKSQGYWITVAGLASCLCLSTAAWAQGSAAPAAPIKGEAMVASVDVTATVAKIDHKTRKVTLKAADGSQTSFVADAAVQNLDQVKKGDIVTATYTEAMVYEVRKGGKPGAEQTTAAAAAPAGAKPAGAVAQSTTVTVSIVGINAKTPSITFKGPGGGKQTYKVASADKLQGVKVGDTVDINYTEAIAIRVEKKPKK
jgi:Cu/Ag efflux protein CusF